VRFLGLLLSALLVTATQAAWAQPKTPDGLRIVKFGTVGGTTDAGLVIADEMGFFREVGLKLELNRIGSGPALLAAVVTEQIDGGGVSMTPGLFAAVQQGVKLKIVGDKQSYSPGFSSSWVVARPEYVKATVKETFIALKGKKMAINSKGTIAYMALMDAFKFYGLEPKDINVVELGYPDMMPGLAAGAVESAYMLEPFITQSVKANIGKEVSDLMDVRSPGSTAVPIVYGEKFAADTKSANAFMVAYMKGVRAYNDAYRKDIDKDKIVGMIARYTKLDPAVIKDSHPTALEPNQYVNQPYVEEVEKFFMSLGSLRAITPAKDIVDPSFANEAVKVLGEYK